MTSPTVDIRFPAVVWREGYFYLAVDRLELCSHGRRDFARTVERARRGEWTLADSGGRCFAVVDWRRVPWFGGVRGFELLIFGSVFAEPILDRESTPELEEFKRILESVVRGQAAFEGGANDLEEIAVDIRAAGSAAEVLAAFPTR